MFAFLLLLGLLRFVLTDPTHLTQTSVIPLVIALAVVYLFGTVQESRRPAGGPRPLPTALVYGWLAIVTVLWCALVAVTIDFVWLLFPLVLLFLQVLPRIAGLVAALALWAIAAFVPVVLHPETWSVGSAVGPAIGTILAVAIYHTYRTLNLEVAHHRAVAQDLQATRAELAAFEHQSGQLEERERLSREIHDTVAQGLSSILLVARASRGSLGRGDYDAVATQLDTIEEQAADNLSEARHFVQDLASSPIEESLPVGLRRIIGRISARQTALNSPLELSLELSEHVDYLLPEPLCQVILRAAQEALANVVRHSGATRAVVTLAVWDNEISLDVVDDGCGFDGHHGYGLAGLATRVESVGGGLVIETSPGHGTALAVRIPLIYQEKN
ncbi:sensor histidine kinase [Corynebacterium alimapuense]|uniref:Sensor histidine kinase n=2 Tax=Corynebacterium alimapuense TaxID=1576874 RepID=A0A3M8K5X5_9CORY|nr:sensor histidine kinase [Corynebacterium alimapuense]